MDPIDTRRRRIAPALALLPLARAAAAPPRAQAQIRIAAPLDRVWRLIADIDHWPTWNPNVAWARLHGPLAAGTVFDWQAGGFTITSTLQAVEAPRRLAWTGHTWGTQALHRWDLDATDGAVLVGTAETFHGWLPWLLPGRMQRTLDETLPQWLAALKAAAEAAPGT